jgi:hypothetical protein
VENGDDSVFDAAPAVMTLLTRVWGRYSAELRMPKKPLSGLFFGVCVLYCYGLRSGVSQTCRCLVKHISGMHQQPYYIRDVVQRS